MLNAFLKANIFIHVIWLPLLLPLFSFFKQCKLLLFFPLFYNKLYATCSLLIAFPLLCIIVCCFSFVLYSLSFSLARRFLMKYSIEKKCFPRSFSFPVVLFHSVYDLFPFKQPRSFFNVFHYIYFANKLSILQIIWAFMRFFFRLCSGGLNEKIKFNYLHPFLLM